MTRSGPDASAMLAILFAGAACAAVPEVASRSFEPNTAVSTRADVKLELHKATYEERMLTVDVAIVNLATVPLEIEAKGILLAEDDLELPLARIPELPVPDQLRVDPGGRLDVRLPFPSAGREQTVLRLRAASRGKTVVDVLELPIPEAPPTGEPT